MGSEYKLRFTDQLYIRLLFDFSFNCRKENLHPLSLNFFAWVGLVVINVLKHSAMIALLTTIISLSFIQCENYFEIDISLSSKSAGTLRANCKQKPNNIISKLNRYFEDKDNSV